MSRLVNKIREAVRTGHYIVGWHAAVRCEERGVAHWQLAAEIVEGRVIHERPASKPHPSIVVRQTLADGTDVQAVWSWLERSGRAKLVTVFFDGYT